MHFSIILKTLVVVPVRSSNEGLSERKDTNVQKLSCYIGFNCCPAEPGFILFYKNTVDPDQLASKEAI